MWKRDSCRRSRYGKEVIYAKFIFSWRINTTNKKLKETLNISNNTNVDFVGEKEGTNEVMITIDPGQTYFIELRGKNNLWKVQPLITYAIETLDVEKKEIKDK